MGAPERQDCIGAAHGPEHAGLFETLSDDRLAAGLDNAGANEQVLLAELRIVHACGVGGEVLSVVADFLGQFRIGGLYGAETGDQFSDLAFVQLAFLMQADPLISAFSVVGKEQACQLP